MEQHLTITKTIEFVKSELEGAEGGHDWWHIYRVWKTSAALAKEESVDLLVVELGALLHDIADSKFHDGDETVGPKKARAFLEDLQIDALTINHVVKIIENISFKSSLSMDGKGNNDSNFHSMELAVVRDADRLDAIGAIGIARTFNYGGFKNRAIHDPEIAPNLHMTKEAYKSSTAPTINHFYEKLLLLKDRMHTDSGKRMAAQRHQVMEDFLAQFYREWEGES
jgi:uncharacterized protein